MSDEYQVREYKPGDEEQIVDLLEEVFTQWPKYDIKCSSLEHWKWKHLGPYMSSLITVCWKGNEIVACDHEQVRWTKIGDKIILCSHGCDSAVHPNHRRKGIYTKTNEFKENLGSSKNIEMSYFVTGVPAMVEYIKKKGAPYFPTPINMYMRCQDIEKYVFQPDVNNKWIKTQGYRFLRQIKKIQNTSNTDVSFDYSLNDVKVFDNKIDLFWEKTCPSLNFGVQRKKEYLNWRYCDPRGGDFVIKQVEHEGEILGFNVLRINQSVPDNPVGYIVDQIVLPDRSDVFEVLTRSAVEYFDKSNVNSSFLWVVNGHPFTRLYDKHGFLNVRSDRNLFYHVDNDNESVRKFIESKPEQLHFHIGDVDEI